jgi:hydroxymethylglutaryl-CoA lyase
MDRVHVAEVGPRDGFQSIGPFIPTEIKIELIESLAASGFTRMEVGSFASPTLLPQMADIRAILEAAVRLPQLRPAVLVPNLRGAELALAAGAQNLVTVVSATESHNQSNTRRAVATSLAELREILCRAPRDGLIRYNIATSFHCPFEGAVDAARVLAIIEDALAARSDIEIGLCDTIGKAMPHEVTALFRRCMEAFPGCVWAFHAHDTYGFGVANVLAAHAAGVRIFDGAVAGLGGCPFAPGASGNVATEDVVYAFDRMGVATNIDLEKLLQAGDRAAGLPGADTGGHVRKLMGRVPATGTHCLRP